MVRTKIPGGKLTSEQLLAELDLCDEVGNTTLRITVAAGPATARRAQEQPEADDPPDQRDAALDAGACGDVEPQRHVLPRAVHRSRPPADARAGRSAGRALRPRTPRLSRDLAHRSATPARSNSSAVRPTTAAAGDSFDVEPIYGPTYLPRKFKTAIGLPDDNCVDLYANDLGLMAIVEGDEIIGYNVLVGGGMGVTPSREEDLSRGRQADVLHRARARCSTWPRRSSRCSATSATAPTARWPG